MESNYMIDQICCPECGTTCLQKNIYRHMVSMHQWNRQDCKTLIVAIRTEKKGCENHSFVCSYCRALFPSVRLLVQHKRSCSTDGVHPELELEVDEYLDELVPEDGYKATTSSYAPLPPHRTPRGIPQHHLVHSEEEKLMVSGVQETIPKFPATRQRGNQTKCPECSGTVDSIEDLIAHCAEKHETDGRKFVIERELFNSVAEFKKWFDQRQEDTCTSLTKRTGHGGETLYRCHRIGKYQSVAKSRKSNPRKIDQTCTAYLKVFTREDDGSTWATGCFTHIGHELDHKLLWLTETQEHYVRDLIDLNWNGDQIVAYILGEYKEFASKLKHFTKNDLRNIMVRYEKEKKRKLETAFLESRSSEARDEVPKTSTSSTTPDEIEVHDGEEVSLKMPRVASTPPPSLEAPPTSEEVKNPDEEYINVVDDEPLPQLERVSVEKQD